MNQAWKRTLQLLWVGALIAWTHPAMSAAAGHLSTGFDAANRLYEQGKFADAVSAYEKLTESGSVSQAVYFNLGNALFKSGQIGRAIAAYRQAEKLDPRDPDVETNLRYVREQITGPSLPPSRWQRWFGRLTLNEWTLLATAAFWVWFVLLCARQVRPAWRRVLRSVVTLSSLATVCLCGCLAIAWSAHRAKSAVVIADEATVHNGPLDESPKSFVVHDGAELGVLDSKNDWLKINAGNQRVGWVKRDQVVFEQRGS